MLRVNQVARFFKKHLKKEVDDKVFFGMQIKIEVFYKLMLWVCVVRYAQSNRNEKFAYLLQYLQKNVGDEVDSLPADKRQMFLAIDTVILFVRGQLCPNYPK